MTALLLMVTIGTDIIDVPRIIKKKDALFNRVLTKSEISYCLNAANLAQSLAGHFAAKEAIYKALNLNHENGISWKDIEISHNNIGAPKVTLLNSAKIIAENNGLINIQVSISHLNSFAIATAVCEWK